MREKTKKEVMKLCEQYNIDILNMRNIKNQGKTRIVITVLCSECKTRYDIRYDTLKKQRFKDLCTSCAHRKCSEYKLLEVDEILKRFENEGYKVLTPKNKIKRRGKRSVYFTPIDIMSKYGEVYTTSCNKFCTRIEYYRDINNCNYKDVLLKNESRLEGKVRLFLESQNVRFKQQFRFNDCRGEKYPLPFDFCLFYDTDNRMLIEVDGERHFEERFVDLRKNDRRKDYYCKTNLIPLLRLSYKDIDNKDNIYKEKIIKFISQNQQQ